MMEKFHEKIVCNKCSNVTTRDIETVESKVEDGDIKYQFKCILIKKFICEVCNENENITIQIVEKNDIKNVI